MQNLVPKKCSRNLCICFLCSWDTFIQGTQNLVRKKCSHNLWIFNSILGTPPFRGHKIWSRKCLHNLVSVTSIEGTLFLSPETRVLDLFGGHHIAQSYCGLASKLLQQNFFQRHLIVGWLFNNILKIRQNRLGSTFNTGNPISGSSQIQTRHLIIVCFFSQEFSMQHR